jgi:DNA gyrase subunit A
MPDDARQQTLGVIEPVEIQEEMERSFLDYAMSVIVSRALPDVRDGLKPVQRRIMWGMYVGGIRPDRPHKKCARVVGDVMGSYHPHGDQAIYDALARMAQNFSLRYPLVDGHGNFGSPDPNDRPAAMRYTECRLSDLAMLLLEGIDENTVDFVDTYDGENQQPTALPARFPNLLVNGSAGIAVGMATNIPPHNLTEVIDATIHLIDNPQATTDDLMAFVHGPDFPTGGRILGRAGILDAYRTGRGSIKMRAVAEVEEGTRGGMRIVVTEVPYQTSVEQIGQKLEELVADRKIDGIRDVRNESSGVTPRLVVELKRDANPQVVLNQLWKHTPMQSNFAMLNLALVDGVPRVLNLVQTLEAYVGHQVEVVTRRSEFRLQKARDRLHIVEGLLKALDDIDAIIEVIRGSEDVDAARRALMEGPWEFSEIQANHILDMQLRRLTGLERQKLVDEAEALQVTIKELEEILASPKKLRGVIKDELKAVRDKHGDERRCPIEADPGEFDVLDLIEDEEVVVIVSSNGYVKSVRADAFKRQGRGGQGVTGAKLREDDVIRHLLYTSAHSYLLFFSDRGKVYRLRAHEIPMKDRTARGMALVNLLNLEQGEDIQAIIDTREYEEGAHLFFATRQGQVKKTRMSEYDSAYARSGILAIRLNDGDALVKVVQTRGADDILMLSKKGMAIRFTEEDVRSMGRVAAGVRGMKLKDATDGVVSCDVVRDDADILVITSSGHGKRTKLANYRRQGRGGQGVRGIKLTARRGEVVAAFMVGLDDEALAFSSEGKTIRVRAGDISSQGRDATGVRLQQLGAGDTVVAAAPVLDRDDLPANGESPAPVDIELDSTPSAKDASSSKTTATATRSPSRPTSPKQSKGRNTET